MPLIEKLTQIPEILKGNLSPEFFEAKYRFEKGGVLIQPINFTQGGPLPSPRVESEENRKLPMLPALANIPFYGIRISVPILYGNTVLGTMKNRLTEYMFNLYRDNNPEVIYSIYRPDDLKSKYGDLIEVARKLGKKNGERITEKVTSALSATLFRMKPPFLSVSYATVKDHRDILIKTVDAIWLNPIFKAWGIGLAPWAPSRSIVSSVALPVLSDFKLLDKFAEDLKDSITNVLDVEDEMELRKITLSKAIKILEESEEVVLEPDNIGDTFTFREDRGKNRVVAGGYNVIKLRQEIARDYLSLGVVPDDEFSIPTKNGKYDLTSPTPVRMVNASLMTLISVLSRGTRTTLHTDLELASFAQAISDIVKFGPNDNVMRIYTYMEFENVKTGGKVRLAAATGIGETKLTDDTKEFMKLFNKWISKVPYDEVIVPVSLGLLPIHVYELNSSG